MKTSSPDNFSKKLFLQNYQKVSINQLLKEFREQYREVFIRSRVEVEG
jgi:hypothetical protein